MKTYITSSIKQFRYYKQLAERSISQLSTDEIFYKPSEQENSISIIMQHISGNMLSRWTDIFNADGEKEWRHRDKEFQGSFQTKEGLLNYWEEGWYVLFETLKGLREEDLEKIIYIRAMGHTVVEAINRQLCHYAYHVGQIVLLAKQYRKDQWNSLSVPLGKSEEYNREKVAKGKRKGHFTDDL